MKKGMEYETHVEDPEFAKKVLESFDRPKSYQKTKAMTKREKISEKYGYKEADIFFWLAEHCEIRPERILDLGCGEGCLAGLLHKSYPWARVLGLDINYESLGMGIKAGYFEKGCAIHADLYHLERGAERARLKNGIKAKDFHDIRFTDVELEPSDEKLTDFDLVTCLDAGPDPISLEELGDEHKPYVPISAAGGFVKSGGWLVYAIPESNIWRQNVSKKELEADMAELKKSAEAAGFETTDCRLIGPSGHEQDIALLCRKPTQNI